MGKNLGPGGKNRRKGKNISTTYKRELRFKTEDEEYASVEKMLGECRVDCICTDGTRRIAHIRGKFKKRIWISTGDVVLVSLREFQDGKADIVHKYTPEEVTFLREHKEITFHEQSKNTLLDNENDLIDGALEMDTDDTTEDINFDNVDDI